MVGDFGEISRFFGDDMAYQEDFALISLNYLSREEFQYDRTSSAQKLVGVRSATVQRSLNNDLISIIIWLKWLGQDAGTTIVQDNGDGCFAKKIFRQETFLSGVMQLTPFHFG